MNRNLSEAKSLMYDGKLSKALDSIRQIEENKKVNNEIRIEANLIKSEVFLIRGLYQESISISQAMLEESEKLGLSLLKFDAIILLGEAFWRLGQYENTIEIVEQGEQEFIKETNLDTNEMIYRYAEFKKLKGIYYRFKGELDLAYEYFTESLAELRKTGDDSKIGIVLNNIGLVFHDKGELNEAWNYYTQSLEMKDKIVNKNSLSLTYFNLGRIQIDRGELDSALEYLMQCLELSQRYGDMRVIGKSYNIIGLIYHNKGQNEAALEYLSKSLSIKKDLGNDLETSWTLYRILDLIIGMNKIDIIQPFYNELELIYLKNKNDKIINLQYRLVKARIYKTSNRTIQRAEAQKIFNDIIFEEIIDYELTINAMLNLCEELLLELKSTGNEQILDELIDLFNNLVIVANEQNSYSLLTEIYILQSKISLLELNFNKAQSSLSHALTIAEDRGLRRLAQKISYQYDKLLDEIRNWKEVDRKESSLMERMQQAELEQYIAGLISKRSDEVILEKDYPILLMVLAEDGKKVYTKKFVKDDSVNEEMIAIFLMAINNIINEAFSDAGSVERLKHGEFMLVVNQKESLSFLYLFKGNSSYTGIQRLDTFVKTLITKNELWVKLNSSQINDKSIKNDLDTYTKDIFK